MSEHTDFSDITADGINVMAWAAIRAKRDQLIALTDWTQMPDSPLSAAKKDAYAAYRQALRDIPESFTDPDAVEWPSSP